MATPYLIPRERDRRTLSDLIDARNRRAQATLNIEGDEFDLDERRRLAELVNPIRDRALRELGAGEAPSPTTAAPPPALLPQPEAAAPPPLEDAESAELAAEEDRIRMRRRMAPATAASPYISALMQAQDAAASDLGGLRKQRTELEINRALPSALTEIADAAELPGASPEQARAKAAALARIAAKYPKLAGDARFKEAMTLATPRNLDFNPFQFQQGQRSDRAQTIAVENQLRDEYEKTATDSRTISRAGADIAAALSTNNPLSVRTAVTKYSKLVDPTTGVLGGEATATEKAAMGDLLNRLESETQKMVAGGMTAETSANFRAATRDLLRVQKQIFQRLQERTKSRFQTYQDRFPELQMSEQAVMGSAADRAAELGAFDVLEGAPGTKGTAPYQDPAKEARYQEFKRRQAAGGAKP